MLLSMIGSSRRLSALTVQTLAKIAPLFGFDVTPDTKKIRLKNQDGTWQVNKKTGKGVYKRVGIVDNRFFLARKVGLRPSRFDFLNDMYILTARKRKVRQKENKVGTTYTSYHRGLLTIARENLYGERHMHDVQNRDIKDIIARTFRD